MRPCTSLIAVAAIASLCACGGTNSHWDPKAENQQEKTYTLTWDTGTKSNGNGTADGYVTLSPGGDAHGFTDVFHYKPGATITVTAHPDQAGTTVDWFGLPGSDPLVRTFTLNGDVEWGCSFIAPSDG